MTHYNSSQIMSTFTNIKTSGMTAFSGGWSISGQVLYKNGNVVGILPVDHVVNIINGVIMINDLTIDHFVTVKTVETVPVATVVNDDDDDDDDDDDKFPPTQYHGAAASSYNPSFNFAGVNIGLTNFAPGGTATSNNYYSSSAPGVAGAAPPPHSTHTVIQGDVTGMVIAGTNNNVGSFTNITTRGVSAFGNGARATNNSTHHYYS